MPLCRSSRRMTRARGQTAVFEISEISRSDGSSLFPVPIDEMSGMPCSAAYSATSSFVVTQSIASAMKSGAAEAIISAVFDASANSGTETAVQSGFILFTRSAATSDLYLPTVVVSAISWRLMFDSATLSPSTTVILPMPARARDSIT